MRPRWMTYPDIDNGHFLEPTLRAFFHDRVRLHKALQARNRSYLAVNQRDDAAFAHEGIGVIGVIYQYPIEGGRKARFLCRLSVGNCGASFVIGPQRRWHAVERVSRQRVIAKARQEFPVGPADGVTVESVGARLEGVVLIHRKGLPASI